MYASVCCSAEIGIAAALKVFQLLKRVARIILGAEKTTPSIYIFNTLKWLPFTKQSMTKRSIAAFKHGNTTYCIPDYLGSFWSETRTSIVETPRTQILI